MRAVVVLLMAVAACAEPSSSPDVGVPRPTAVCPAGAPAPRAPPAPRTVDAIELDWNGLQAPNLHSGILLQNTAQNVRIVGGGSTDTKVAYGIYRMNPATVVQLAAADGHYGLSGVRNF